MIFGRESELAEIDKLLARVGAGDGGLLVVIGEPGMGKTTLLEWAAGSAERLTVLRAAARESEADLPFVALADLLRPASEGLAKLRGRQAEALRSALALVAPTAGERGAVKAAVLNLLSKVGQRSPVVLLIDDYHWLDSASREVIDFVARRTEPFGIGLLLTTRGPVPADHGGSEVRLAPLSTEVASALVSSHGARSPEATRRIVELAAGNPLALVELPMHLTPQELAAGSTNQPVAVGDAVQRAFRARLEALPGATNEALVFVAAESFGSAAAVLRALRAAEIPQGALDAAVDTALVRIDGHEISFRHPLVRSVILGVAGPGPVRRAHLGLADAVDDEDQRAWHLAAAAIGPDEAVAGALDRAAGRALERGAAASATEAFQRAASLSESHERRSARLGSAARAAHRAGNMSLTSHLVEAARSATGSSRPDPSLLLLEADIRMRRGDFAGAYGALRREAAAIAAEDPHLAVTMLLLATKMRVYRFEAADALSEVEAALALLPDAERDLVHLSSLAMTRTMAGRPGALEAVLAAMTAAVAAPHGHTHTLGIGWPLVWLEEYETARKFIVRSVTIQREGGHLAYLPQALLPMAELEYRTGHWDLARSNAEEALRLFEEGQQPTEAAVAMAFLAKLEAVTGIDDAALGHVAGAIASDVGSGLKAATAYALAAGGLLHLGRGRYPEAIARLGEARSLAVGGEINEPWLLPFEPDLAEAYIRSGDKATGKSVAQSLIRRSEELGRQSAVAAGLRCLGLSAPPGSYAAPFERALAIHEQMSMPFETARTELCFGERLRRDLERVAARDHLRKALATFETLGAEPWIYRAQIELSASGEKLQRRNPVASLTPQERQVANLVAGGATNREAAAMLFVSAKTIEFHLGNVYRKLGVRSRTELANRLHAFSA